jgi:acyl-CoA dehydrogenase
VEICTTSLKKRQGKQQMNFDYSDKVKGLQARLLAFMDEHIYPNEMRFYEEIAANRATGNAWLPTKLVEELKPKARAAGLWNLFIPHSPRVPDGLSNLEYAPLCEIMGRVSFAAEVFNSSAPDTGNMETFERYASEALKVQWLEPLLRGEIRSAFLMTEPAVASSDATNIQCSIVREGNEYVINGTKWWSSGAGDPRCAVYIVMGKTDPDAPKHSQQSMVVVPANTPGVKVIRPLSVFGYDDAPHGHMEVTLTNVRVPVENLLLGEGRGFEIAQGRLGPGRIHHCMRSIGAAERALELMCKRLNSRIAFGKPLSAQGVWHERIANARIMIEQSRLLTLKAAYMMDTVGNKDARAEIAMIKVIAPNMASQVIDWAIQAHGAAGVSDDFPLAYAFCTQRWLRLADGPDEVHRQSIAKLELARHIASAPQDVEMPITRGS